MTPQGTLGNLIELCLATGGVFVPMPALLCVKCASRVFLFAHDGPFGSMNAPQGLFFYRRDDEGHQYDRYDLTRELESLRGLVGL